ncbi:MAG: nucleotidyl transferase AbiEii/AbiGii toxin family protein [Xanthomonadaceae bacterium]|nr:nucleotidyl transferase AbiEii/AbiGii toxin family protein [Xanthomonadaceae bacterium]
MAEIKQVFFERFLRELFHRSGEGFVLKGGVAMQALFREFRLTKDIDLDFTNPKRTAASLHNSIRRALDAAARATRVKNFQVRPPGKDEQSPRWKVNFDDSHGGRHHLEVEVSRDGRRAVPSAPVQVRYTPSAAPGIAPFWVDVYDVPSMIASKLAALLGRTVPVSRDVYDLDQLCAGASLIGPDLVEWAMQRAEVEAASARTLLDDRLAALSWDLFESELLTALPARDADRMNPDEWDAMKTRVRVYLDQVLP